MTTPLPVDVDTTYADSGTDASVKLHQQHHDALHRQSNARRLLATVIASNTAITNVAPALAELGGAARYRTLVDLTTYTEARIVVSLPGSGNATSELRMQYATDGNTQAAWAYVDGSDGSTSFDGPGVSMAAVGGAVSPWKTITAPARGEVWLRLVTINGDGAADPVVGHAHLAFR